MKPIKILALILITIVFFSCSEKEATVIKEELISEETRVFKYNSNNGYIESITAYNNNNIETSHFEYEYNAKKQLVKSSMYLSKKRIKSWDNHFTYDEKGYVKTEKRVYPDETESKGSIINFDYEITGGSIKVKKNRQEGDTLYTYEYKNDNLLFLKSKANRMDFLNYDNKKNPYYEGFPLGYSIIRAVGKNNILKEKRSGDNNPKKNITINYQYEYNSDNFPIKTIKDDNIINSNDESKLFKIILHYKYEK